MPKLLRLAGRAVMLFVFPGVIASGETDENHSPASLDDIPLNCFFKTLTFTYFGVITKKYVIHSATARIDQI